MTIETALVGGIAFMSQQASFADTSTRVLVSVSSVCFVLSAIFALWLVGAAPSAIQQLPFSHTVHQFRMWGRFKLVHLALLQHLFLALGVFALLAVGGLHIWGAR
ncbi:MAG: hypothetical protein V2I66_13855 [Halieaceae bacterium]|nr:hypothetical protein [Halieaceae bacterium]